MTDNNRNSESRVPSFIQSFINIEQVSLNFCTVLLDFQSLSAKENQKLKFISATSPGLADRKICIQGLAVGHS